MLAKPTNGYCIGPSVEDNARIRMGLNAPTYGAHKEEHRWHRRRHGFEAIPANNEALDDVHGVGQYEALDDVHAPVSRCPWHWLQGHGKDTEYFRVRAQKMLLQLH